MFGLDISLLGWIVILAVVALGSYIYMTWPYNYFKNRGIPGPKPIPVLGNMKEMGKQPFWMVDEEWVRKYGKVFGTFFFGMKSLIVSDVEMLKEIFIKDFDNFCDRTTFPNRGILRYSLTDVKGQVWRNQRHQMSPYFSAGTLKMSAKPVNKILDNLIVWLEEKCDKGEMVEAKNFAQMMTLDVICSTAFGVEVNSCKNPDAELLRKSRDLFKKFNTGNILVLLGIFFPSFAKLLDMFNVKAVDWSYFEKLTSHLITEHQKSSEGSTHDFVNILLKERKGSGKGLSDNEIIANAILFLLAGYDTTAGSLSFLLYNLTVYPECQEKAYQEVTNVLGNENPTYENVQELSYLDMCLDESLRLFPLAPRIDRVCVKDTVVKGVAIEKGLSVGMPIWCLHRDPEIWENPETFDPERFTPEKKKTRDPLTYAPFGVGPRHCIGMRLAMLEIKMATARLLQKFKLVKNAKTQVPLEFDPKLFGMAAKNGIWLTLERRA